jgi:hypothetical protein
MGNNITVLLVPLVTLKQPYLALGFEALGQSINLRVEMMGKFGT